MGGYTNYASSNRNVRARPSYPRTREVSAPVGPDGMTAGDQAAQLEQADSQKVVAGPQGAPQGPQGPQGGPLVSMVRQPGDPEPSNGSGMAVPQKELAKYQAGYEQGGFEGVAKADPGWFDRPEWERTKILDASRG